MKVLTANRLVDGEAVWFSAGAGWIEVIDGAEIARDTENEEKLRQIGERAAANNEVVDVDLIDVDLDGGVIVPKRLRERIRAAGPTNRLDLGKQANAEDTHAADAAR